MKKPKVQVSNQLGRAQGASGRIIFPEDCEIFGQKGTSEGNFGDNLHFIKFVSLKCRRVIELESHLELARVMQLEMDPGVFAYKVQPFYLEYEEDGVVKAIFPRLLVSRRDGSQIIEEIKPAAKAALPSFQALIAIEKAILAKNGYRLSVLTEKQIQDEA